MEQSVHLNHSAEWHFVVPDFEFVVSFQGSCEDQRVHKRCKCCYIMCLNVRLYDDWMQIVTVDQFDEFYFSIQVIRAIDQISLSYVGNEHLYNVITDGCIEKYNKGN